MTPGDTMGVELNERMNDKDGKYLGFLQKQKKEEVCCCACKRGKIGTFEDVVCTNSVVWMRVLGRERKRKRLHVLERKWHGTIGGVKWTGHVRQTVPKSSVREKCGS